MLWIFTISRYLRLLKLSRISVFLKDFLALSKPDSSQLSFIKMELTDESHVLTKTKNKLGYFWAKYDCIFILSHFFTFLHLSTFCTGFLGSASDEFHFVTYVKLADILMIFVEIFALTNIFDENLAILSNLNIFAGFSQVWKSNFPRFFIRICFAYLIMKSSIKGLLVLKVFFIKSQISAFSNPKCHLSS